MGVAISLRVVEATGRAGGTMLIGRQLTKLDEPNRINPQGRGNVDRDRHLVERQSCNIESENIGDVFDEDGAKGDQRMMILGVIVWSPETSEVSLSLPYTPNRWPAAIRAMPQPGENSHSEGPLCGSPGPMLPLIWSDIVAICSS